jgi:Holliday junction resolvase RusA-like endonuclease
VSELARFQVVGRPRTKGSLKVITPRGRKPLLMEDHAHSAPWRKRIKSAIMAQVPAVTSASHIPYKLPVRVTASFTFERLGPSAQHLPWPVLNAGANANGDLDKLLRNLLDAMKDAKLIADDSLVVTLSATKQWAGAQELPGISVLVEAL